MLHLERALKQLSNVMEYANGRGGRLPKNEDSTQPSIFGAHLRRLEENAVEKGEAGLGIALAKPFQRLLKYHLSFRILLTHHMATTRREGVLKMVTETETIVGGIEDERVKKEERDKVWDVLGRIDGLDKIK